MVGTHSNSNLDGNFECYATTAQILQAKKKQKRDHLSTITLGWIDTHQGLNQPKHQKRIRILFDSGCAATLVKSTFLTKLKKTKVTNTTWNTKAGSFSTKEKCNCVFSMPEFHTGREIEWKVYVDETPDTLGQYDMIMGRDLLDTLGIDLLFSQKLVQWDNATIPMRNISWFEKTKIDQYEKDVLLIHDPISTEAYRIQGILDMKYAPADLEAITEKCTHLTSAEQVLLLNLLQEYEDLFDGSLGTWQTEPLELELREDANHIMAKHIQYHTHKKCNSKKRLTV